MGKQFPLLVPASQLFRIQQLFYIFPLHSSHTKTQINRTRFKSFLNIHFFTTYLSNAKSIWEECVDFTYQAKLRTSEMSFAELLWWSSYTQLSITAHFAAPQVLEAVYHCQSRYFLLLSLITFLVLIPPLCPQQGKERHEISQAFKPQSKNSGPHPSRHEKTRFTAKLAGVFSPKKLRLSSRERNF